MPELVDQVWVDGLVPDGLVLDVAEVLDGFGLLEPLPGVTPTGSLVSKLNNSNVNGLVLVLSRLKTTW